MAPHLVKSLQKIIINGNHPSIIGPRQEQRVGRWHQEIHWDGCHSPQMSQGTRSHGRRSLVDLRMLLGTGSTGVLEGKKHQKPGMEVGSWKVSVTEPERGGFRS